MLVLTRRDGEELVVGNNCFVKVIETARGKVRLGIEAPHELPVNRKEVWIAKQNNGHFAKPGEEVTEDRKSVV